MFKAAQLRRFSTSKKANQSVPKVFNPGCPLNFNARTMTCNVFRMNIRDPNTSVLFGSKLLISAVAASVLYFGFKSFKKQRYFRVILFWTPIMAILVSSYLSNSVY